MNFCIVGSCGGLCCPCKNAGDQEMPISTGKLANFHVMDDSSRGLSVYFIPACHADFPDPS
jgi:hypothetical protein